MVYPAHIRSVDGKQIIQTVTEHCVNTARYASEARAVGLEQTARLAGLLHDTGKFTPEFCRYITRAAAGEPVHRGSVNHTFAGVRMALERWSAPDNRIRNLTCELIAYAAGAHHGLFDCIDAEDGFSHRMKADQSGAGVAKSNFLSECVGWEALDAQFLSAEEEITRAVKRCRAFISGEREGMFALGMVERLLLSYVIDADRRDTAEFMLGERISRAPENMRPIWLAHLRMLEEKLANLPCNSPINEVRRLISNRCREAAVRGPGIYRLSVPTGGGKTLTALRYALAAGATQNCPRIFMVVPLLSVLEQNAAVIRAYLEDDSLILEHHSNVIRKKTETDELDVNELLIQNWHAPVVVTTLVQLLNTLFSAQTTCIRRMQALAGSVIVIDEVQSVPRKMLSQFNLAMNFLAGFCGATVVLCSATQPCFEELSHKIRYGEPAELVAPAPSLREVFRRTEIVDRRRPEGYTPEELACFAREILKQKDSLLVICNTKRQAKAIYRAISAEETQVFHLSTAMCMQHRIETLRAVNRCLAQKQKTVCVSTQLVEAGVDFSFACVVRVSAGMDNVIQAAGRCNRSGEYGGLCPVYIVNVQGENLNSLREIRESQVAAEGLLTAFAKDGAAFDGDLASDAAIRYYYRRLFTGMPKGAPDYTLPEVQTTAVDLLSLNRAFGLHCSSYGDRTLNQAFKTAGSRFCVFDSDTTDLLVPFGEGDELIVQLQTEKAKWDLSYRKALLDRVRRFTVSLYEHEVRRLSQSGGLYSLFDGAVSVLQPGFYRADVGFALAEHDEQFMEV